MLMLSSSKTSSTAALCLDVWFETGAFSLLSNSIKLFFEDNQSLRKFSIYWRAESVLFKMALSVDSGNLTVWVSTRNVNCWINLCCLQLSNGDMIIKGEPIWIDIRWIFVNFIYQMIASVRRKTSCIKRYVAHRSRTASLTRGHGNGAHRGRRSSAASTINRAPSMFDGGR